MTRKTEPRFLLVPAVELLADPLSDNTKRVRNLLLVTAGLSALLSLPEVELHEARVLGLQIFSQNPASPRAAVVYLTIALAFEFFALVTIDGWIHAEKLLEARARTESAEPADPDEMASFVHARARDESRMPFKRIAVSLRVAKFVLDCLAVLLVTGYTLVVYYFASAQPQ